MRVIGWAGAALAMLGLAQPAGAQPSDLSPEAMAEHLAEVGTWDFAARENGPDGKPECREVWHFEADGTGWVQSAEQRTTLSWAIEQGEGSDRLLLRTPLTVSDGPDCMGRSEDPSTYPRDEEGFVVMFFNAGGALTCRPAAYIVDKDGEKTGERMLRDEDCWGSLNPAPQG